MDQQPKIPTLKDAQKPQVKIKGMGAGLTLFDRLKQFKKKDLAFILAGLGTLFMAPLAEHFMMAPENGDASLQKGWGGGSGSGGSNLFGSGSSPYESGNNNIASGGAIGGAGDIITPLNVRDPSALVMGPGAAQQPPAGSAAPATPPPTAPARSETDYKDALAGAASRAASAAVKKAPLPVPKIAVGGSGLRGLGAASGSTSASGSMLPVGPAAGSNGTGGGSGLNLVRATPNFKGVAGGRSPTGGTGLDNTKRAGANAGDAFNRAGSAQSALNAAASEAIPTAGQGYGGGGQGGSGANDKPGGGSGPGGSKSVGESLAFIEAKERMMEKLKLEFEKKKLKDPELLLYGIRNDVLKASAAKVGEGLTTWGMCKGLSMGCPAPDDDYDCGGTTINKSQMTECKGGGKDGGTPVDKGCWTIRGSQAFFTPMNGGTAMTCNATGKKGDAKDPKAGQVANEGPSRLGPAGAAAVGGLNAVCTQVDDLLKQSSIQSLDDGYLTNVRKTATQLVVFRDSMFGKTSDCASQRASQAGTLDGLGKSLSNSQVAAFDSTDKLIKKMIDEVQAEKVAEYQKDLNTANDSPTMLAKEASTALEKIDAYVTEKKLNAPPAVGTPPPGLVNLGDNKAKLEALKKTLDESQSNLSGYLDKAKAAQQKLDGQTPQGGKPLAADATPILKELGAIAVEPGTLPKIQAANVDYAAKKEDIEKVTKGMTINRTPIEPKVGPVGEGVTTAKTKVGEVPAKVPPEKIKDEKGVEKDNPEYEKYRTAAKDARTAVESVRGAQATWLVNVQNDATTAKTSLTGAPTQ